MTCNDEVHSLCIPSLCSFHNESHFFEIWESIGNNGFFGGKLCLHKCLEIKSPVEFGDVFL